MNTYNVIFSYIFSYILIGLRIVLRVHLYKMSDFMNYVIQSSQKVSSLKNDKYYKFLINKYSNVNKFFTIIVYTLKTIMMISIVGRFHTSTWKIQYFEYTYIKIFKEVQ